MFVTAVAAAFATFSANIAVFAAATARINSIIIVTFDVTTSNTNGTLNVGIKSSEGI